MEHVMSIQAMDINSTSHTVNIFQDFIETLVLPNLLDDLRYRVCGQDKHFICH